MLFCQLSSKCFNRLWSGANQELRWRQYRTSKRRHDTTCWRHSCTRGKTSSTQRVRSTSSAMLRVWSPTTAEKVSTFANISTSLTLNQSITRQYMRWAHANIVTLSRDSPHLSMVCTSSSSSSYFPTFMWGRWFVWDASILARSCAASWHLSLRQVVPDDIQPHLLRSSSSAFSGTHHHHSLAHTFFFSSQYMQIPLQPTFR